jgi:mannose-6-phosphate isomerase-like protein (cupin superfamily)
MSTKMSRERFRALSDTEGSAFWFLGTLVYIKASNAQTNGAFTLIEQLAPPGFGPPLHIHHVEDELFWVLEGAVRFRCGDQEVRVEKGGSVFLPKGVPHAFRVEGQSPARVLQLTTPGGFDRFVEEITIPAPEKTLPPAGPPPPDLLERVASLGAKFHFTLVGPPL